MYLLLSLFSTASAQSWLRRAYYDDTQCTKTFTVGISLPASFPCQQTTPLTASCIVKGQDPAKTGTLKSAEASGCMVRDGPVTDAVWVPTANEGKLAPGANYLTVNAYTDTACAPTALYEQDIFLADNNCYAVEYEKSFYKATCNGNVGTLTVCNDSLCKDCTGGDLNAGMFQVKSVTGDGTCTVPSGGMAFKVVCSVPGATTGGGSSASFGTSTGSGSTSTNTAGNGKSNSDQKQVASLVGITGLVAMMI